MSKKFFRPPPQPYGDSEEEESEEDDDEELVDDDDDEEEAAPKRRVDANLSDDDDDEEEEEDHDDDEEEDRPSKKRGRSSAGGGGASKKKKSKAHKFFELEAEASDDDEEEYSSRHNKDDENMDEEAREIIRQQDRRRAQAGGRFGQGSSVAEISRAIEERHRMANRIVPRSHIVDRPAEQPRAAAKPASAAAAVPVAADLADEVPDVYTNAVAQQSLVPSVSDPSFWMVSCATGKEQELVFQIMNKCIAFARQGKPLGICGAIVAQSKGKIYIESFSEPAVVEAIQGVRALLQYTMRLVPIQDMTTVMTVVSKQKPVQNNEWVRMTRGHYKGDLALVKAVKEPGLKCIVQCVPRLDLTLADLPPEEARIRRRTVRPPQKFFNAQEVNALGRQSLRRQRFPGLDIYCDYFEGNYFHDGYLLKEMTVGSMVKPCTEEDPPSLDELQAFQRRREKKGGTDYDDDDGAEENEGSKMATSLLDELAQLQGKTGLGAGKKANAGGLVIGDTVEVIEGDLVGMRGKLVSIDGESTAVKVQPHNANVDLGGTTEIEFLVGQVRKYISVGAHVRVTDGRYENETGVVVAVEQLDGNSEFTAVVLTDVTNKEISVRTSQLRESAEVNSGQGQLSGYELYDLVVLSGGGSANEIGVIVRVGREDFTVINNHGIVREARPEELRGKRNSTSTRAVALDVQGNQIRCGDTVNVAEGPHKGKAATIKRMSRAQLFLHSQTRTEHAGIFVVRSRSCMLAGSRNQGRAATTDAGFGGAQASRGGPPGGAKGRRDDGMVGKTVRVTSGQWKGYIGTVSDTTATHVQVELHSRLKKVMVVREKVVVVGDKFGATENASGASNTVAPINPVQTMATPMHAMGGATPGHNFGGGDSPDHEPAGGDEVWRPGGSIDQEAIKDDGWGGGAADSYNDTSTGNGATKDDGWGSTSSSWGAAQNQTPKEETNAITDTVPKQESSHAIKHEQVEDLEDTPVWFMERVCVQLKNSDKRAVIKEVNPDKSAVVEMEEDKSTRTIRASDVSMVPPSEHDTVLVTGGNEIGLEGSLVCVDGSDAILKDANDEFRIIDFVHLVKITDDS